MTDDAAGRRSAPKIAADGLDDLTDEVLPALIARLRASRLGELEVRTADWRVRLRRDGKAAGDPVSRPAAAASGGAFRTPSTGTARLYRYLAR